MAASIAGFVVDGDSLAKVGTGFENTEEYQNNLTALRQIQNICGIAYLYTLHTDDNVRLYYGIDTDDSSGNVVALLGCDYDASFMTPPMCSPGSTALETAYFRSPSSVLFCLLSS